MKYYGGIEGGCTSSHTVIIDESGEIIGWDDFEGTNVYNSGFNECINRICKSVERAMKMAGLCATSSHLESLGLSLSGAETESVQASIEQELVKCISHLAKSFTVKNDMIGSALAAVGRTGIAYVLISGTGSNSGVVSDGKLINCCGGMGYMFNDAGSAYSIAQTAMAEVIAKDDGLMTKYWEHDTINLKIAISEMFNIKTRNDVINFFYNDFSADKVAKLTEKVAELANAGDQLSFNLFHDAGRSLADYLCANLRKIPPAPFPNDKVDVVCIGSMWESWDLLKEGFLERLILQFPTVRLRMLRLIIPAASGAAMAATNDLIPHDPSKCFKIIFDLD